MEESVFTGTPGSAPAASMRSSAPVPGKPLVSILVPSFNGAPWLREALDSLLAQTYPNIEIILLDDASTDDTPAIAAEYEGRIRFIRQPRNMGIYDNVNVGIAEAKGELVATYHADDIYLPTIVEEQVAYLQAHPEVGAVFASDIMVDADGREYGRIRLPEEVRGEQPLPYPVVLNTLLSYKNNFLVCPTAMVRAAVHRDVGVYRQDRYRNTSDLEMWLRIARRYPIAVLESHLMKYRHFHGNSSQRYHRLRTDVENYFLIMDEYLAEGDRELATPEALVSYEAHRSKDRLWAAMSHYIKGEPVEGRRALGQVRLGPIARSPHVQKRLLAIAALLWLALRLPRSEWLAERMRQRWHVKRPPRRRT
jgi:glycosyltransferase involved in cell wall biosynthesis